MIVFLLFVGLSYFIRMLGPAIGYTLASFCLSIYISPTLTPFITKSDPRWLGAWWIGTSPIWQLTYPCTIVLLVVVCRNLEKSLSNHLSANAFSLIIYFHFNYFLMIHTPRVVLI